MTTRASIAKLSPGKRTLARDLSRHLCKVLRLEAGQRFVAFDPETHREADVTLLEASDSAASIEVGELRAAEVVASVPLVLVYALAKGDKVDAVVRDATELGATRILIAQTSRTIVRTDSASGAKKRERWAKIADQAARQCGRADPPAIEGVLSWNEALTTASRESTARYCLYERATTPLGASLASRIAESASLAFAIGPEGGLSEEEVREAESLGFTPVSLGPFILRTETVAAAVFGAVRVLEHAPAAR